MQLRTMKRVRASHSKAGYMRIGSLLMLGALVYVLYSSARDISNWKWLTEDAKAKAAIENKRLTVGEERRLQLTEVAQKGAEASDSAKADSAKADSPKADSPKADSPKADSPKAEPEETFKQENPNASSEPGEPKPEVPPGTPDAAETKPSENKPAFNDDGQQVAPPKKEPETLGPTDLDDEEIDKLEEEGQAISDGGLDIRKEEMPAYWRMFMWANNQTTDQLLKRPRGRVTLHDMMRRPDNVRGKLVKLNLHVQRILSYDVADDNIAKVKKVYEIWGWSDETKAWLYCGLTSELPDKMPLGSNLHEDVTFIGYFYKVQGYMAASSRPSDKPLSSPLLIGRVIWHPAPPKPAPSPSEPYWIWGSIIVAFVLFIAGCAYPFLFPKKPREAPVPKADLSDWSAQLNMPAGNPAPGPGGDSEDYRGYPFHPN